MERSWDVSRGHQQRPRSRTAWFPNQHVVLSYSVAEAVFGGSVLRTGLRGLINYQEMRPGVYASSKKPEGWLREQTI